MAKKQIKIEIDTKGGTVISTTGYKGRSCKEATAALERELGTVTETHDTPEMLENPLRNENTNLQRV